MEFNQGEMGQALAGKRKNLLVDDIINKACLAIYLDCTEETITYYQKEFGLPFIKVGSKTYFSIKSTYNWLIEREKTLVPEEELKKEGEGKPSKGLEKIEI